MTNLISLQIPEIWRTVLDAIGFFPRSDAANPYIAGGALRDLVLGRLPKGIDIFTGPGWNEKALLSLGSVRDLKDDPGDPSASRMIGNSERIERIVQLTIPGLPPFNIIERKDNPSPREILPRFDFGICRIAWDEAGWMIHEDFLHDLRYRVFTARAGLRSASSTLRRAECFALRFPGWGYDLSAAGGGRGYW